MGCAHSEWSMCTGHRQLYPLSLSEGCTHVCLQRWTRWTRVGPQTTCRSLRI